MEKFAIIFLIGSVFISGCVQQAGSPAIGSALLVFDNGSAIYSIEEAKDVIVSNSEGILDGTLNLYAQISNLNDSYRYASFKWVLDNIGNRWNFNEAQVELRGCCTKDGFWVGNLSSEKYVATILSSTTGTEEVVICNDPSESAVKNEQTGEVNCGSGIKERRQINLNSRLMYILDGNGKVYFAGAYPNYY